LIATLYQLLLLQNPAEMRNVSEGTIEILFMFSVLLILFPNVIQLPKLGLTVDFFFTNCVLAANAMVYFIWIVAYTRTYRLDTAFIVADRIIYLSFCIIIVMFFFRDQKHIIFFWIFSSFLPQIIINWRRKSTKVFHPSFIIITSVTTLVFALYIYVYPGLMPQMNYNMGYLITFWITSQAAVLIWQSYQDASETFEDVPIMG